MLNFIIKSLYLISGVTVAANMLIVLWCSLRGVISKGNLAAVFTSMAVLTMAFIIDTVYYLVANLV